MKSILQSIALLSAAVLIASCDSSSGGGAGVVVTQPAPQISATGSAVKGLIDGATVTASDTGGTRQIASSTVTAGTYNMVFDPAFAPFVDPIVITVTGGSALCDFDNPDNSGNDCQQLDGSFAVFGASYDITGTVLRSNMPNGAIGGISNASPLSEIAASKAPTPLTVAGALQANLALTGLIETITGVSFGGVDFTTIAPSDLTATGAVTDSPAQLALAAFGAAVIGNQNPGETISAAIARLTAGLTVDPATGNIAASGTSLATFSTAYASGLAVANDLRPSTVIGAAAVNATAKATAFTLIGDSPVIVSPSAPVGSETSEDVTRAFVTLLSAVIGDVVATTGAQGGGSSSVSTTEAFATELDAVANLTSGNATIAFNKLDAAVIAAATGIADGATVTNDATSEDGILFTLVESSGTLTLSGVSSAWPIAADIGNRVVITGAGTATASSSTFSLSEATVTTSNAAGTSTAQTFTGTVSYAATAGVAASQGVAAVIATFDATLTGNIQTGDADPSFAIDLGVVGELVDPVSGSTRGTYTASFAFTSTTSADVTVALGGTIGATAQTVTFTTPSGVITSTVTRAAAAGDDGASDQVTLTDGNATLTLVALTNGSFPASGTIGSFSVGTTLDIATLSGDGFVTYADGSVQILPLLLFPDPSAN